MREAGIGYAVDGESTPPCTGMMPGPDTGQGVLLTVGGITPAAAGPACDWTQIHGATAWLGLSGERPGPADLARKSQRDGHAVRLADGNEWLVPVARALDGTTPLPRRLALSAEGVWVFGDVTEEFAGLYADACRVFETFCGEAEDDGAVLVSEGVEIAVRALAVNYRIGPAEISALGLFTSESQADVLKALVDWPALDELKKKLDSDEPTSPPTAEDSSEATPPQ